MPRIPATTSLDDALSLSQRYSNAMLAVVALRDRLSECEPHTDNFSADSYGHACNEHQSRIDALNRILLDLGDISQATRAQALDRLRPSRFAAPAEVSSC